MRLDVITILISLGILCSGFSIAMLLVWRFLLPRRSLMLWGIGMGCYGAGVFLVSLRGFVPSFFTIIIANLLIVCCYCIVWWGVSLYRETPPWTRTILLLLIMFIALYAWFTYMDPLISARHVILRIFIFFFALGATLTLLKEGGVRLTFMEKAAAWMFMLDGTFKLSIVAAQLVNTSYHAPLHQNMITGVSAMMSLIGVTSWGLAVILMMLEKTTRDLRESEERYRFIVENVNDAIYIHDFEGNIIDVNENACRMVGYERYELVGANLAKIDNRENTQYLPMRMEQLMRDGSILFEGEHVHKDGSLVPIEVSGKVITRDGKGIIHGFVRNITVRKQAEEERERFILELREALSKVKLLSGFLPICSSCKKIRNDNGYWEQIEMYVRDHSEAEFSHGICPECAEKLYPEFYKKK